MPYVRGREKSRPPIEIVREIERLVDDGVKKKLCFWDKNVNSYGKTFNGSIYFCYAS